MTWQNPWAWAGLATLALPVLVHLLSRAPAVRRLFPSLRFIDASRLSPRRRTRPRDLLLLAVRLGVLGAAVAALAGPSLTRDTAAAPRVVRAIVLDTSASMTRPAGAGSITALDSARRIVQDIATAGEGNDATSIIVETAHPMDAMPGMLAWLARQPGAHEIVIVSDFQRGAFDAAATRGIPPGYGLRLVRVAGAPIDSSFTMPADHPATAVRVTVHPDATDVLWTSDGSAAPAPVSPAMSYAVTLHAGDAARARLRAAMAATVGAASIGTRVHLDSAPRTADGARAVDVVYPGFAGRDALLAGASAPSAPWTTALVVRLAQDALLQDVARTSRVAVASSANPGRDATLTDSTSTAPAFTAVVSDAEGRGVVLAAEDTTNSGERLLLVLHADADGPLSAALVAALLRGARLATPLAEREPVFASDAELAALGRPATDRRVVNATSPDGPESFGRWLWALALLLLAVEAVLRRTAAPRHEEAGVREQAAAA
jgi:hypothetical protein